VYKDIDKAFPLYVPGLKANIGASIEAIKGAPVNLNADYETKIQGLLYSLDELNQSLMMTFRAIYVSYQSDPCKNSDSLYRQVEKIIDEHNRQTALRIKIRGLIEIAEMHPENPEKVIIVYQDIVHQLGGPSVSVAASLQIKESRSQAKRWIGGKYGR
jgi:hypothetical protein